MIVPLADTLAISEKKKWYEEKHQNKLRRKNGKWYCGHVRCAQNRIEN